MTHDKPESDAAEGKGRWMRPWVPTPGADCSEGKRMAESYEAYLRRRQQRIYRARLDDPSPWPIAEGVRP